MSVCPLENISTNHTSNFTKCSVHVTCRLGLVPLWRQCNMLCTSGFVDDVMFSRNRVTGPESETTLFRRFRQMATPGRNYCLWLEACESIGSLTHQCPVIIRIISMQHTGKTNEYVAESEERCSNRSSVSTNQRRRQASAVPEQRRRRRRRRKRNVSRVVKSSGKISRRQITLPDVRLYRRSASLRIRVLSRSSSVARRRHRSTSGQPVPDSPSRPPRGGTPALVSENCSIRLICY